jgi:D-amino-acid dehydrogenase
MAGVEASGRPCAAVIGAGIVGVCSAAYLQRAGFAVELIDRAEPGGEEQCSFGNAGGICPGSCVPIGMPGMLKKVPEWLLDPEGPLFVRLGYLPQAMPWILRLLAAGRRSRVPAIADAMRALHREAFEAYAPLLKEAGCEDLIASRGQLFVHEVVDAVSPSDFGLTLRRERGVAIEFLTEDEIRQREPALAPRFRSAVFLPEQGQCRNPGRLVATLAAQVVRNGGTIVRERVTGFEPGAGGIGAVLTEGGRRPAGTVVLAAGAWSRALAARLGYRVPMETERGYHVQVTGADPGLRTQTIWAERKFVASPMEGGLRFAGTIELAGLHAPPNYRRADALLAQGLQMIRGLSAGEVTRWMGNRPGMPDSLPVLGRAPYHSNLIFAFGHGHTGLIAGAVTGRIVADLASGITPSINLAPYRLGRF